MANLFDLQQYKCKTCGEPLDISKAKGGVIKCGVCDSVFTLPKDETPSAALDFLRQGEHDLDTCKFDDAYAAYSKAAELDKTEPEAYFGMALAEFKIQYLKDEVNNKLQPICHEVTDKKFAGNSNFLKALRYATEAQRAEYERKAEEIEYIMTEFFKLKKSGIDYDCFICVKVSDDNGGTTEDSALAHKIYRMLKKNSYEPFYSEAVLKNVTGADYEAHILYALASSETMLIVCFDEGYLRTKWVKNEYTRYLKLVNDEEKESDSITVVYKGKPIEKLPNRKGKLQGIDADELDFSARILKFVESHTPEAKKRREEEAKRKSEENEALKRKLAELEARLQNTNNSALSDDELLERLEKKRQENVRRAEEAERKARKEAELKVAEEQARIEAEREKRKEAERKAAEERARIEAERKAAEEKVRKEAEHKAAIARNFEIENGVLKKYKGNATQVIIPDGVKAIGNSAFEGCRSLTSITIPSSVTSIGNNAFCYCGSLSNITIPDGVTSIGYQAFYGCRSLTSIIIPDGVTSIGFSTFVDCRSLTSITIPDSVTSIGSNAFNSSSSLHYNEYDNALYLGNENNKYVVLIKAKDENIITCEINPNTKRIYGYAFYNCGKLTNIIIPNSVKSIGEHAFFQCWNLKSITIPVGVTSIAWHTFCNCEALTDITIPNSVTYIGMYAFCGCKSLTSIKIPDSVTCIDSYAFYACSILKSIKIPDGVTSISSSAFGCCRSLTSITVPDSVKNIGVEAFCNCEALKTINFSGTKKQWKVVEKGKKWDKGTGKYKVICSDK